MFGLTSDHPRIRGNAKIRLKKLSSPVMASPNPGYPSGDSNAKADTGMMKTKLKKPFPYNELLDYCDHTRAETTNKSRPPAFYVRKLEFSTEEAGISPRFDLVPLDEDLPGFGTKPLTWSGRMMTLEHRVAMIKTWLSKCKVEHADKCGHVQLTLPAGYEGDKLLVVDVQRGCLTEITPSRSHYFALSYVWGRQATFQTLKHNIHHLRQPGSISYSSSMLPKTIRDAIKLLIALDEQYLWCDRLCIVQDDAANKHSSISRMNEIFGSAHAVIMARSGLDADAGLLSRDQKHPWHQAIRLSDSMRFVTLPSRKAEEEAGLAPLEDRGWAYQEKVLAWRTLTFNRGLVSFQCCQGLWREDITLEGVPYDRLDEAVRRRTSETFGGSAMLRELSQVYLFPRDIPTFLARYSICLRDYSKRTLTYQSDALSAFEGILQTLASWSKSSFHIGLPRHAMLFFITILWETGEPDDVLRGNAYPTWSWVAWKGTITTRFQELYARRESWVVWFEDGYESVVPFHDDKSQVCMPEDIRLLCGNVQVVEYPFRDVGLEAPLRLGSLRFYTLCASFRLKKAPYQSRILKSPFIYLQDKYGIPCGTLCCSPKRPQRFYTYPPELNGRQNVVVIARGSYPFVASGRHSGSPMGHEEDISHVVCEEDYVTNVQKVTGRTPRRYEYEYPQLFVAILVDWVDGVAYRKCPQIAWIVPAAFSASLEHPQWGRVVLR